MRLVASSFVVVATAVLAGHAPAQLDYESTYPFSTPLAVASDSASQTIYAGAGSGIIVFNGSSTSGEPVLATSGEPLLHAEGMVRDMALTPSHVYAAAGRNGLVRFLRGGPDELPPLALDVDELDASSSWTVDVAVHDFDDLDLVFVGTNDDESGGAVHLVHAKVSDNSAVTDFDQLAFNAPVYAVASRVSGNSLVLLVGTACGATGTPGIPTSLWRYDFDLSAGLPQEFPSPSADWRVTTVNGQSIDPEETFVRDIVIDPAEDVAYVAAFTRGIHKIDLSTGDLVEDTSGDWPIVATQGEAGHWDGLALYDGSLGTILVAALGPPFSSERLWWTDCTFPVPCDHPSGNTDTGFDGVRLYDVAGTSPIELGAIDGHKPRQTPEPDPETYMPGAPLKVAVRQSGSSKLRIDAACDQKGSLTIVEADAGTTPWTLTRVGHWGPADPAAPVLGSCDDALQLGDDVFVTSESSINVFDLTATDPFEAPVDVSTNGGVLMSGFLATGSYPTSVFVSALDDGFIVYEWNGTTITHAATAKPPSVTRVYDAFAMGPGQTSDPSGQPWLFLTNLSDINTLTGCGSGGQLHPNGSVLAYKLEYMSGSFNTPRFIGGFRPPVCSGEQGGSFLGCHVERSGSSDDYAVWIPYSPFDNGSDGSGTPYSTDDSGLIFCTANYDTVTGLTFNFEEKVQAFADPEGGGKPARIRYDAAGGRIYVCYSCDGLAAYDVSTLLSTPTLAGTWSPDPGDGVAFLDAWAGPGGNVYVADISGAIYIFDATDIDAGPIDILPTRGQATGLWPATTSSGAAFFLADSRAGVHKIVIDPVP
jgi:hypothetical protein